MGHPPELAGDPSRFAVTTAEAPGLQRRLSQIQVELEGAGAEKECSPLEAEEEPEAREELGALKSARPCQSAPFQ